MTLTSTIPTPVPSQVLSGARAGIKVYLKNLTLINELKFISSTEE